MAEVNAVSEAVEAQDVKDYTPEERAAELKKMMSPARLAGESFSDYKDRRTVVNKMMKVRLRGAGYLYENKFVPVPGTEDPETGEPMMKGVPYVKNA